MPLNVEDDTQPGTKPGECHHLHPSQLNDIVIATINLFVKKYLLK